MRDLNKPASETASKPATVATVATVVNDFARQAISTHYLGPTNHRGARVVATAEAGRVVIDWDYALGVYANHARAAERFAAKFGWDCQWAGGGVTGGGYCFVQLQLPR